MSDLSAPTSVAVFGGVYANHLALAAVLEDARRRGATAFYCLGDLGGFGPHPDRVMPLLLDGSVTVLQGNYDDAIGHGRADCGCGYTDPRDNHFAQLSYDYTRAKTSERWLPWLRALPTEIAETWAGRRVRMAHGSPRQQNEFLWESASSDAFLRRLLDGAAAELLLVTHTGLPWQRRLSDGRQVINVGAIGRPANHGRPSVSYSLLTFAQAEPGGDLVHEQLEVDYEHERLADEMRREGLPPEFIETIRTGWWTTCLEILPGRERRRGKF